MWLFGCGEPTIEELQKISKKKMLMPQITKDAFLVYLTT